MDELADAAAVPATSIDVCVEEELGPSTAYLALSSHDVLRPVGGNTDGDQDEGHDESQEQPPAEVPLLELKRLSGIMFSGQTGAVVTSGEAAATSAPTFGLVMDMITTINELEEARPELFDRHAEHRPCGLLCKYGAGGMLLCEVLGLPLVPWVLAEPIGKAAAKIKEKLPAEKKKVVKKAKRRGADAEVAASALLRRRVEPSRGAAAALAQRDQGGMATAR